LFDFLFSVRLYRYQQRSNESRMFSILLSSSLFVISKMADTYRRFLSYFSSIPVSRGAKRFSFFLGAV